MKKYTSTAAITLDVKKRTKSTSHLQKLPAEYIIRIWRNQEGAGVEGKPASTVITPAAWFVGAQAGDGERRGAVPWPGKGTLGREEARGCTCCSSPCSPTRPWRGSGGRCRRRLRRPVMGRPFPAAWRWREAANIVSRS
jgi:hypothetical protein